MNKENAKDYLPLVQALAEGKAIQVKGSNGWNELANYDFTSPPDHYRMKPEPRVFWVNRYPEDFESGRYSTREDAASNAAIGAVQVCYREVIE
ncbi:TPA: hypothetical protein QDZ75_004186 [Stenotrophomonas maltophilia]|nr:hypothetical protein [Stenotrophomonas maltophilia]